MNDIFQEELIVEPVGQRVRCTETLYSGNTGMQDIKVIDTLAYGRVLVLDGIMQTSERDEFIYHEMMTHVPLLARATADRPAAQVLIVGGGDGGSLEEVLKHPVDRVTMVEIDGGVIDVCRRYLPAICGQAFDDPRANVIIGDGARFVAEATDRFDVIIVDSTDPFGPGEILFSEAFYARCRDRLTAGGVIVTQAGIPFTGGDAIRNGVARLAASFGGARGYLATIPLYVGGMQLFGWASRNRIDPAPAETDLQRCYDAIGLETRYYSPAVHRAAFVLPPFLVGYFR